MIPKKHYQTLFEMDPEDLQACILAAQKVGKAVVGSLSAEGLNLVQNNYRAAGQLIDHAHFHLIPRQKGTASSPPGREALSARRSGNPSQQDQGGAGIARRRGSDLLVQEDAGCRISDVRCRMPDGGWRESWRRCPMLDAIPSPASHCTMGEAPGSVI